MVKSRLLLLLALTLLSGCGPMYSISYEYIAPKSSTGKQCINQCITIKQNCKHTCALNRQLCRMNNTIENLNRNDKIHATICNNTCFCNKPYQQCYKNCGGKVIQHKTCTAFCD